MANPTGKGGFKLGKSGNPSGRPKVVAEVRDLAREKTPKAIETLSAIMEDVGAPPSARVAAASALLDRGWGKAPQTIKHEGLEERLRQADDATLDRIAAKAMAALGYPVDDDDGSSIH